MALSRSAHGSDLWAVLGDGVGLSIRGSVNEAATTQTQVQSFSFEFEEAVIGFEIGDVEVSGATIFGFSGVSETGYKLDVMCHGGFVSISVARGAAHSSESGTPTLPAQATFFYQDRISIKLPNEAEIILIRVPSGSFTMGSSLDELSRNDDEIPHEVTLSRDLYWTLTEVTQQQWESVMGSWPATAPNLGEGLGPSYPAYHVSWHDANGFAQALNDYVESSVWGGLSFSLPTEAEWEYAARAGSNTRFGFGDAIGTDDQCTTESTRLQNMWYCGNNDPNGSKQVASKLPNNWGLHDMHGNVWEWCLDWYGPYNGSSTNPTGPTTGDVRVMRGGGWNVSAASSRAASRLGHFPSVRFGVVGFRVVARFEVDP